MADDESFDELMAQSSLGSAGAQSLRDRTSSQTARLVLRIAELRDLAATSTSTDPLSSGHLDELRERAFEQLRNERHGDVLPLVETAHNLAQHERLDEALVTLTQAKNLLKAADDWEGYAHVLSTVTTLLIRAGRNAQALAALREMSQTLARYIEPVARSAPPADQLRPDKARQPTLRRVRPEEQDGPGSEPRMTFGGAQQETAHRLLLAIDAQGFGGATLALQRHSRQAMPRLVHEAAAAAGLHPEEWWTQDGGDSLLVVLPPATPVPTLLGDFMHHLDAGLRAFNRERVQQASLRLRAAVHQGAVSTDAHGFVGWAVNTTISLADSAALHTALTEAPNACLAVGVSEAILDDVVRSMATRIGPDEVRQVSVEQKQYRGKAWIWVPGASPRPLEPRLDDAVDAVRLKSSQVASGGSGRMDAFTAGLLQRIRAVEAELSRARQEGDDFLIEVEETELADLQRLAAERGVEVGDRWPGRSG